MSTKITVKPLGLPGLENFRIKHVEMATPVSYYATIVVLEKKVFGPFWKTMDSRFNGEITDAGERSRWSWEAEKELLEDWL